MTIHFISGSSPPTPLPSQRNMSAIMKYGFPHSYFYIWLVAKNNIALLADISFRHNFSFLSFNSEVSFRDLSFSSPPYGKHIMALAEMSAKR